MACSKKQGKQLQYVKCSNNFDHNYMFSAFQAYRWCIEAMKEITVGLPVKVVVDVLRQASKVFFLKLWSSHV